ncbi:MAG TPA: calcium-binding protein [Herpetosiphonaceae bacterium]
MSRMHRMSRLLVLLMVLLSLVPQRTQAVDLNANRIADGLRSFSILLDTFGGFEELGTAIPLTDVSPGGEKALRLNNLFKDSLRQALDRVSSYENLTELRDAIDAADGTYGGVFVTFDAVKVERNAQYSQLIDVGFTVAAKRTVTLPLAFSEGAVNLSGGGIAADLTLATTLNFQLNTGSTDPALDGLAFYLQGTPRLDVHVDAKGTGGGTTIGTLNAQLGFTNVTVTGSAALDLDIVLQLLDPDGNGKLTEYEWTNTALADLAEIKLVDDPSTNAINAQISLDSTLIDGSPDGTIILVDASLADGLSAPSLNLSALTDFTNIDPAEVLSGLAQLASGLLASQGVTDPKLPFLKERLGDAMAFAEPLVAFIKRQGDAAIICGKNNTTPPTGDVTSARAGDVVYCQAVALQTPTAATWSIKSGTGTLGVNTTGANALKTVGVSPTANAQFKLKTAGKPQVEVKFTDPSGAQHTVAPRFISAQDLFEKLTDQALGGFDGGSGNLKYDRATKTLTYRLKKSFDPKKIEGKLDFGDQLRSQTNLIGLSPDSGASVEIDPSNVELDVTFGVILVADVNKIVENGDVADRFFIKVRSGAGEHEFRADTTVKATVKLRGQIGPIEVTAEGKQDATAFEIAPAVAGKPMVAIDIKGPGIKVGGSAPDAYTIPDAIRIRELLGNLGANIQAACNVKLTSGIAVKAGLRDAANQIISGGVDIAWPDVFGNDCLPDPDTLNVTPSLDFNDKLKVLDIAPFAKGTHNGANDSATLVDGTRDFSSVPGLVGSTLKNTTDGSSCNVTSLDGNTPSCVLTGGAENDWDAGDKYEVGGDPLALLYVILDSLDRLATVVETFTSPADLDKELPIVGVTPRKLITQFRNVNSVINDIRSGPSAVITCGTNNTDTPTGDVSAVPDGTTIYCQATGFKAASGITWEITGGTAGERTSGDAAKDTVGVDPTANAVFVVNDGDPSTPLTRLGDYKIRLKFTDSAGEHSANYPVIQPSSLEKLEELIESKLDLPPQALAFSLRDLPLPGQTTGDGIQDLVVSLGYGICTTQNTVIAQCASVDRTVPKLDVPVKFNLGDTDLIQLNSESSLALEYAARARLDLAVPLPAKFDPGKLMILDSTGVELEAGATSDNLNLSASIASLTVKLGNNLKLTSGKHTGSANAAALDDSGADFTTGKIPVGARLKNITDGSSCSVTSVAAKSLTCTLAGGAENDWDTDDAYEVFSIGTARIGARFALQNPGTDGNADGKETIAATSFLSGLKVSFGGPQQPVACGKTDPDGDGAQGPVDLNGDACAKLSIGLQVDTEVRYLGDIDFRIEDITKAPDDLGTLPGWYVSTPQNLEDEIAKQLLDWTLILRAVQQLLLNLEQRLDGASSNTSVPLVGKALDAGANVAHALRTGVVEPLITLGDELKQVGNADGDGDTTPDALDVQAFIKQKVFEKVGPSGAKLLLDNTGDGSVTADDVKVALQCTKAPSNTCRDNVDKVTDIDDVRITVKIGQGFEKQLPFDIGLAGLPLRSAGNLKSSGGWSLLLDFGLNRNVGPYLVAGGEGHGNDPELNLGVEVGMGDAPQACAGDQLPSDPNSGPAGLRGFSPTRCIVGQLGFLHVTLRDGANGDGQANTNDDPTRLALTTSLDLRTTKPDQRLSLGELFDDGTSLKLGVRAEANVDLRIRTGFTEGSDLPSVLGTFHLKWDLTLGESSQLSQLRFGNLHLDVGSFVSRFLEPLATNIRKVTSPLQPVIDTVRAPLPVLSDLAKLVGQDPISLYSLMKAQGYDTQMIDSIISLIEFINKDLPNLKTDNLLIPLGSLGGAFDVNKDLAQGDPVGSERADALVTNPDSTTDILSKIEQGSGTLSVSSSDGAFGVKGLSFPFLSDSKQIFGLLMGKDVTIVRYEPGTLRASAGVSYTFGPIMIGPVPVSITISGSATIEGRIAIGYDTSGIRQVIQGGSGDRLLDGIFIDDLDAKGVDVPEIKLIGLVSAAAGVDLGLVAAGVDGGIQLTVGMNLNDSPNPDGKLRIDEVVEKIKNPVCLFDISGKLEAFLGAFVRIGIGFFKKTFRFDIVRVTLIDFTVDLCKPANPNLADKVGDDLVLKIGPNAGGRGVAVDEKNEEIIVRQLDAAGTRFGVSAFGVYEEVTIKAGGRILGDGGDGNDAISLEPGAEANGDPIPFTARAVLSGGSGSDRIKAGDGNDTLNGNDDSDRINGGGGVDTIDGGAGDDVLSGELGDDTIHGGSGNDSLIGGPGTDTLNGNEDDDSVIGGPSTDANPDLGDTVAGGPGHDTLEGNQGADILYGDNATTCDAADAAVVGDDQISGGSEDDQIFGGAGSDKLVGDDGNDRLCGNVGNDTLDGDTDRPNVPHGHDVLDGGSGSDELHGRGGEDDLFGQDGDDKLFGDADNDDLSGGRGSDELDGSGGRDYLLGDTGSANRATGSADGSPSFSESEGDADTLRGGEGADVIFGEGGGDQAFGDAGNDRIAGNDGADTLRGGSDDDTIAGNAHDDLIFGDSGADRMTGNTGNDTMRGGIGTDTVEGNEDADTISGDADNDILIGGSSVAGTPDAGDTIDGNGGADVIAGDNAQVTGSARAVTLLDATLGGSDLLHGNEDDDRIYGGAENDEVHGDANDDYLEGNAASDLILGGADQDDIIGGSAQAGALDGADRIYGGNGVTDFGGDFDVLLGDNGTITRPLSGGQPIKESFGPGATQVTRRVVTLFDVATTSFTPADGVSGGDELYGDAARDLLYGQGGNDLLLGGAGDDALEGNAGDDTLYGGAGQDDLLGGTSRTTSDDPATAVDGRLDGEDRLYGSNNVGDLPDDFDVLLGDNAEITRPLSVGLWQVNTFNAAVVRSIRFLDVAVVGGPEVSPAVSGDDRLLGEGSDDLLYGQGGDDTLGGGSGDDYLEGNAGSDLLQGDDGNDDLVGGTGRINDDGPQGVDGRLDADDHLLGGAGFDVLAGDNALLVRTLVDGKWQRNTFNAGIRHETRILRDIDSPHFGSVSGGDTLEGGDDDDLLYGQGSNDTLSGNADDDLLEGNAGGDTLHGNAGQDDIVGGTVQADLTDAADTITGDDAADVIIGDNGSVTRPLAAGLWQLDQNTQAVLRDVTLYDVQLAGGTVAGNRSGGDTISGGGEHDRIFGQGDNDTISGGDSFDYIEGNHGADTISGDAGEDDIIGGSSADDGVIDADRVGNRLLDGADTIFGDDGTSATAGEDSDVIAGDNARIGRAASGDGAWRLDPNTGDVVRTITLFDVERLGGTVSPQASGSDRIFGEDGRDLIFGQGNSSPNADGDSRLDEDPADGVDNDRDGRESATSTGYDCLDGSDNDGDGQADAADTSCAAATDEDGGGDELHGGAGPDSIEGNHGSDWIFGDDDEDDLLGGNSAGDGVIGGTVAPTNLLDGHDVMQGGDDDDVLLADNATIERETNGQGIWQKLVGGLGAYDLVKRITTMEQTPEQTGAYGDDHLRGNAGHDDLYGQLGGDLLEGNAGEDAIVGDLGRITNRIEDGTREREIAPQQPFISDTIFVEGTLTRQVDLFSFVTGDGAEGDDTLLGGDGDDSLHGGAGYDLLNGDGDADVTGSTDQDRVFGGDGNDALWGGRDHDHLWGGYGDDYLDVKPRPDTDSPEWFTYGGPESYDGIDYAYGGWGQDALQANVGDTGPVPGDRLMDWVGAYNVYYVCPGAYGEWMITRSLSPGMIRFLQELAEGDGADNTANRTSSGFRELAMVFSNETKDNANPVHPDNPGHFTCN